MRALADLPIRKKIAGIILITTIFSLGIGFTVVILSSIRDFEQDRVRTTGLIADTLGAYSAIYLAFPDDEDMRVQAQDALAQLQSIGEITDAYLFDEKRKLFEAYSRSAEIDYPQEIFRVETFQEIREGYVHYFAPIFFDGKKYGYIYMRASTQALDRRVRDYIATMLGLMLVLVLAAIVFAYVLQGFISKPILDLAAATQRISAGGDYSVRVSKPGDDEIGSLYDGFNNMLAQVDRRQQELERSNRDLDQFAYVASHDLKAPLRGISTLSEWLEEDLKNVLSEDGRKHMSLLRSRVKRMDALIEGILQYSRVGRSNGHGETVDVARLLTEITEILAPPPNFVIDIGENMPTLVTARMRLEQVFSNLINNAIKYHDRQDGRVEITCRRVDGFFEFLVADDGPGIAPEHHQRIFEMFRTLQPRDKVESTGLGLALVKRLIEEEGGQIMIESELGKGATFRFTWPASPPRSDADSAVLPGVGRIESAC